MHPIINTLNPNHPIDSCPVFYDSYGQRFFTLKDGQLHEIYQESNDDFAENEVDILRNLLHQLPIDNILEMLKDWEREKYPERFL